MIARAGFAAPGLALRLWACALAVLCCLALAADAALYRLAAARDARDYRRPLADVSAVWDTPRFSPGAAKEAIDRAIDRAPDRPEPRVLLGHLHYRLEHWNQAIAAYNDAIRLGTQDAGIRQNIVWCHVELGEYATAAAYGKAALAEGHAGPLLERYTGEALIRSGDAAGARGHFERALEANPDDRHLMYRLVDVYQAIDDAPAATAMLERISKAEARLGTIGNGAQ